MSNYRNAYAEVYTILQELDEEEYNKIPLEIIETIKTNRNEEYEFELYEDLELKEHFLLPETKAVLFNLFRDYLSTPEQKQKIIKMQNEERQKNELKKKEKYNKDLFASVKKEKNENTGNIENIKLIKYNDNIFKKILDKIKNFHIM